ncbi:hypothetical protein M501DRAFT_717014 [Patellaria atrata CBS 101060]|uniref:SH3 domain-containing protein n=1 Tax=Patellaria atrata CBS 101060 TaxID=1346257 RepID=A0A9P4SCU3_9PEZI|nr:hypothetical protein M501DRAFT_717014 [Patellaria atrata CBS 101060]
MAHRRHQHHARQRDDSNLNGIVAREPAPAETIVSVVFFTLPQTFDGPVNWVTQTEPPRSRSTRRPNNRDDDDGQERTTTRSKMTLGAPVTASRDEETTLPTRTPSRSTRSTGRPTADETFNAASSPTPTTVEELAIDTTFSRSTTSVSSPSAAATSDTSEASSSSGGMSAGAKAGVALGVLLIFGVVFAFALFFIRRKKQKNREAQEKLDNEKVVPPSVVAPLNGGESTRTSATAPRLSLRPVTQFLPMLAGDRRSTGNKPEAGPPHGLTPIGDSNGFLSPSPQPSPTAWERKGAQSDTANNPANPFGNHAETLESMSARNGTQISLAPSTTSTLTGAAAIATAAAVGPAIHRKEVPKPVSINSQATIPSAAPSPAWTESSELPASPGPAPTGAPPGSPGMNNVHRVHQPFVPSMEDELDLHQGQLVRMVHEYDDGWALCIRMDRTQQGVVPRSCLSKHPVRPRLNGTPRPMGVNPPRPLSAASGRNSPVPRPYPGPQGPHQRAMSPAGHRPQGPPFNGPPRAMSPGPRAMSPGPRSMSPGPRTMSPGPNRGRANSNAPYAGPPRSQSPGPYGYEHQRPVPPPGSRRRSNSASQMQARRNSPPGSSPMNPNVGPSMSPTSALPTRKPVPGQAL